MSANQAHVLLLLCASAWGAAFAAQKEGMESMGPFLFSALRFALALGTVYGALFIQRAWWRSAATKRVLTTHSNPQQSLPRLLPTRREWIAGGVLALFFTTGMLTQQVGLVYTSVANSAFITGFYVVLVPLWGRLLGQRLHAVQWFAALLALGALYLLCFASGSNTSWQSVNLGDALTLVGALAWTFHVYYVGVFSHWGGVLRIMAVQFLVCTLFSAALALGLEPISWAHILPATKALLYAGVVAGGLAFFLQMQGQKYAAPTSAAVILSSEVLFGALAGWWFLHEALSARAWLGGLLMLSAMILTQVWGQKTASPSPFPTLSPTTDL